MDYKERQRKAVIVPPDVAHDIWAEIKRMRDHAIYAADLEADRAKRLSALLHRMKNAGMAAHLPTIEEVQAAYRGD